MKIHILRIIILLSIIFYNCTHTTKNLSEKDYNINRTESERIFANTKSIQNIIPIYIFYENERHDKISYDLILQKGETDLKKFGFLRATDVECIIPRTKTEFSLFYNGYRAEKEYKGGLFYHYCDSLFSLYAIRDSLNIFYVYLNMYRVMDLQVANEEYCLNIFNRIEDVIYNNKKKYDELYLTFDDTLKKTYNCFNWE